ncbi:hypothetical protein CSUNSWCD_763 [Campylobacter showae CSUNSWCD]|uniref:Uncharacterized protein n=1 Tax=Campylobacter showae CSUNSWCD TaxID=1244083 RepID=M5IDM5_9BACT|nr:hypothetical protein CSUNSWCD_763 [Campylobacter showae CSUNSWCD]
MFKIQSLNLTRSDKIYIKFIIFATLILLSYRFIFYSYKN